MKIITLTLNPAFDVHCSVDQFKIYHENVLKRDIAEAGGKGVNISRALNQNGVDNLSIVIVGDENKREFCKLLDQDGLNFEYVSVPGRIRENITVHEHEKPETRISFEGFSCDKSALLAVKEKIGAVDDQTIITFTGSLPNGILPPLAKEILQELKSQGAKIVIDSRSFGLSDILDFKPWLIKPNKDEAEKYLGKKIDGVDSAAKFAKRLNGEGVQNVIISLGGDGAVLACGSGCYAAKAPPVEVASTIGAGDSMIAGFIAATDKGYSKKEALKLGVSYGTAACLENGTRPPDKKAIKEIFNKIDVTKL